MHFPIIANKGATQTSTRQPGWLRLMIGQRIMGKRAPTNRQRAFVEHYLTCWNASEAARRAGYKGRSNTIGDRLLSNVDIAEEIERRLSALKMGADEILTRLAELARGEHAKYIQSDGKVDIATMKADGKAHLIKSITPVKDGLKIEFYDMEAALVHLGKAIGALSERMDVTSGGKGIEIKEIIVELPRQS